MIIRSCHAFTLPRSHKTNKLHLLDRQRVGTVSPSVRWCKCGQFRSLTHVRFHLRPPSRKKTTRYPQRTRIHSSSTGWHKKRMRTKAPTLSVNEMCPSMTGRLLFVRFLLQSTFFNEEWMNTRKWSVVSPWTLSFSMDAGCRADGCCCHADRHLPLTVHGVAYCNFKGYDYCFQINYWNRGSEE